MSIDDRPSPPRSGARVLIVALTATIIVLALALVATAIGRSAATQAAAVTGGGHAARVNVLAESDNTCVTCHQKSSPGIVEQYGHSTMAAAGVTCQNCHEVAADYPGAIEHEGTWVLQEPTTAMCAKCHAPEVAQFNASRHALPSYVAYAGEAALSEELHAQWAQIPEGGFDPEAMRQRNAIAALEGPEITKFACNTCHDIGLPAPDGSVGQCSKCHIRHEFSLEQVRKPETCNQCHIGPDHPQWEIYHESPHGVAYSTMGHTWNWEATPGTLTSADMPAATCAVCHISGFGGTGTTHDVGDRLTWYLFAPVSARRPAWQDNMVRMQGVCSECHNQEFIQTFYADADVATEKVNAWVHESDELLAQLKAAGVTTQEPFDQEVDFTHFELWHHWGRTAKFGVWMQGPDYVQWHGAYEILSDLTELRTMVGEVSGEGGSAPPAAGSPTPGVAEPDASPTVGLPQPQATPTRGTRPAGATPTVAPTP